METLRLILRQFTADDAALLLELDSDAEVMRYINGGIPSTLAYITEESIPRILAYYESGDKYGYWAALEKPSNRFIGWFHFRPSLEKQRENYGIELGYRLARSFWGQGYATEGSKALLRKGFLELGTTHVFAIAVPENVASIQVMKKIDLTYQTTYTHESGDVVVKYGIDKTDFDSEA